MSRDSLIASPIAASTAPSCASMRRVRQPRPALGLDQRQRGRPALLRHRRPHDADPARTAAGAGGDLAGDGPGLGAGRGEDAVAALAEIIVAAAAVDAAEAGLVADDAAIAR